MSLESASVKAEDYAFENEKAYGMLGSGFKKKLAHQISVARCSSLLEARGSRLHQLPLA